MNREMIVPFPAPLGPHTTNGCSVCLWDGEEEEDDNGEVRVDDVGDDDAVVDDDVVGVLPPG